MKIQCACGAKYAFDVTPEMAENPVRFVCQNCGLDSSDFVNGLIRQELGLGTPVAIAAAAGPPPPPVSIATPRLHVAHAAEPAGPNRRNRRRLRSAAVLPQARGRALHGSLCGLPKTDLPEVHGTFRLRLLAAVQGQGRSEKNQGSRLCRAENALSKRNSGGRPAKSPAPLAPSWPRCLGFGFGMRGSVRSPTRSFPFVSPRALFPASPGFAGKTRLCSCMAIPWRVTTSAPKRKSGHVS